MTARSAKGGGANQPPSAPAPTTKNPPIASMPAKPQKDSTPDRDLAHFAARLRKWRTDRGLFLKQCAIEFGVAEATWSRWEKQERFPSPAKLRLLAEFVGIPICCFFYQEPGTCPNCPGNPSKPDEPIR